MDKEQEAEKRVTLRIPLDLWWQLRSIAKDEKRSLNAQIIYIIQEWLKERESTHADR